MKIEIGESLFYSWLRHVKECQIVQTNWKASAHWPFDHTDEIENLYNVLDNHFIKANNLQVFKQNASLMQFIRQGECDVWGINISNEATKHYVVDVAFHENGLNYGSKEETVAKVLSKCIRAAFFVYGYMGSSSAEIIFASPKINPAILSEIHPHIDFINTFFSERGFSFVFRLICNQEFEVSVLKPILICSEDVADTCELFMRSYQMFSMFANEKQPTTNKATSLRNQKHPVIPTNITLSEMKIGQIVRTSLKNALEAGNISNDEIEAMQTLEYSKKTFGINFPLLTTEDTPHEKIRYYSSPITIKGKHYYLCSQWYETAANNDRPYLLNWLASHQQ